MTRQLTRSRLLRIAGFPACIAGLLLAGCAILGGYGRAAIEYDGPLSPEHLALDASRGRGYVTEATGKSLAVFSLDTGAITGRIPLLEAPTGIALDKAGAFAYVTCGDAEGRVAVVDILKGRVARTITVGDGPCAPVMSPDGRTLYVANRFDATVSFVDIARHRIKKTIQMMREPIAEVVTPDGGLLFVAQHLPTANQIDACVTDGGYMIVRGYTPSNDYASRSAVVVYDLKTDRYAAVFQLPKGSTSVRGICISPDGAFVYITHILAHYLAPTTSVDHGAMTTNAVSIIDVHALEYVGTVLLDDPDRGAANPHGITCSPDGARLFVTHAGTHEISIIDRAALHERLGHIQGQYRTLTMAAARDSLAYDLTFLSGIRQRVRLAGNGPRGIAASGALVYAADYFSDTIGVVALSSAGGVAQRSIRLGSPVQQSPERLGEQYFNDAEFCRGAWQSCASCHPDGRADGLNWDLMNDGEGNPKNTKSLLFSHVTPPAMITGIRKDAETAVRAGIEHILFTEPAESLATAMDAYLRSMKPVPSPYRKRGKLSSEAKRGEEVFNRAGCGACHIPPLYTDRKSYMVGTGVGNEFSRPFDTPALAEIWRTEPYLCGGQAPSMLTVLTTGNEGDMHGQTRRLGYRDLNDLVMYVLSQ